VRVRGRQGLTQTGLVLAGATILITGAIDGPGSSSRHGSAPSGANVVVHDRTQPAARQSPTYVTAQIDEDHRSGGQHLAAAPAREPLIERRPAIDAYKTVSNHYIQPSATATIEKLGLAPLIEARGAVHNSIDLWTPGGG